MKISLLKDVLVQQTAEKIDEIHAEISEKDRAIAYMGVPLVEFDKETLIKLVAIVESEHKAYRESVMQERPDNVIRS